MAKERSLVEVLTCAGTGATYFLLWRGYSYFGRVTSFNKFDPKGSGMAATYFSTLEGLFLLWTCSLI